MSSSRSYRQYQGSDSLLSSIGEVTNRWIPIQGWILEETQAKIRAGFYEDGPESWPIDLAKDCSLAGYVMRELGRRAGYSASAELRPLAARGQEMQDGFDIVLQARPEQFSKHNFTEISRYQALQLRHSIASRASAAILAARALEQGANVDVNDALSGTLVRQIAQNVIAWNHPRYHAEAWESCKKGFRTSEAIFLRGVGYGPQELANYYAREWHLAPEIRSAIAYNYAREGREEAATKGSVAGRLNVCSEVIARLTTPAEFPLADQEWKRYSGVFQDFVDESQLPDVLRGVGEQLDTESEKLSSQIGRSVWPDELQRRVFSVRGDSFRRANRYLPKCPETVHATMCGIYDLVPPTGVSVEALNQLAARGLASLGYKRGCVYVFSRSQSHLLPSLRLGEASSASFPPLTADTAHPLVESAFREQPQRVVTDGPTPVVAVQGSYLFGDVVGALTLQHDVTTRDVLVDQLYFRLFRQMLYDLLTSRVPE